MDKEIIEVKTCDLCGCELSSGDKENVCQECFDAEAVCTSCQGTGIGYPVDYSCSMCRGTGEYQGN
jgi:hypothetical protein